MPDVYNSTFIDEVVTVGFEDAKRCVQRLAKEEGILCGVSSGAALYAALEVARREESKNKVIVVILPDTGERYLTTELFK